MWPWLQPTLVMLGLTLAELGLYLHTVLTAVEPVTWTGPVPFCSPLIYNPYRRYEAWRYISYMWVIISISINSLVQTEQILMVAVDNRLLCREMNEGCTSGTDATSCSAIVNSAVSAIMSLAELNVCSYTPGISSRYLHYLYGCY